MLLGAMRAQPTLLGSQRNSSEMFKCKRVHPHKRVRLFSRRVAAVTTAGGVLMSTDHAIPDFVVGGAPRSGTTFLCELLAKHPKVYVARPFIPEPKVCLMDHPAGDSGLFQR